MTLKRIVMNYTVPPSIEDLDAISASILQSGGIPDELLTHCGEEITIVIEDIVEDHLMDDLELSDPFELVALYKSGKAIAPGIERKVANDDDILVLYRRALLDMWSETGEDLQSLVRQTMIEELGRFFELSDDDIQDMADRGYQSIL